MKLLFVSHYPATPHFETELELIADHLQAGDDVHVLRCTGQLRSCLLNPEHLAGWCQLCTSKIGRGLASIRDPRLALSVMPEVAADPRLPAEFASVDELKSWCLDGANLGRGVYSTVCSRINKDTRLDTRRHAAEIRKELEAAYQTFVAVRGAIERVRPDRVYVFNGRFSTCYPVILACEKLGVEYVTHERGGTPDRYLLRRNALPHDIAANHRDILACWQAAGDERAEVARRWYRDRRAGSERSWLSFTKDQAVGSLPPEFDPGRRNIAIFNSTMEEYASIPGWENPLYPDEVRGLARIVESLQAHPGVRLYLRVHPNLKNIPRDDNYQLREYSALARTASNLTVIWPESRVHTYALLDHCDVTLTFGSTMGAEACFWKKPSVLAGRALYEGLGCAHTPANHDELMALLVGDPAPKPDDGALQYGYWETVRGTPYHRFQPTGLFSGTFEGRECHASLRVRVQSAILRRLGL